MSITAAIFAMLFAFMVGVVATILVAVYLENRKTLDEKLALAFDKGVEHALYPVEEMEVSCHQE